ncbi:hypothetical protein MMC07_000447 [Pseudocyphellaria aurata]|nr:hypothetical protein [Pseudocyphellaria aurata]
MVGGARNNVPPDPQRSPAHRPQRNPWAIQLPPLNSPRVGPLPASVQPAKAAARGSTHPSGEGFQPPVTPQGRVRAADDPKLSDDSFGAREALPAGLQRRIAGGLGQRVGQTSQVLQLRAATRPSATVNTIEDAWLRDRASG